MKNIFKIGCGGLIALIALVFIIGMFSGDEESNDVSNEPVKTNTNNGTNGQSKTEVKKEEKPKDNFIKEGTYKVGVDIDAGEYLIVADSFIGYAEAAKDSTGTLESIIFNMNLTNNAHSYVTIADGQYFKVTGAKIYPVATAPSVIPKDGVYKNGQFKVGTDIPAGEYKYILESTIGIGYIEVSKSSSHNLMDIITNENAQADGYITVKDGQYLTLQDVRIETK